MYQPLKKYACVGLLGASLFLFGCGQEGNVDDFVIGKNRISCLNATITVTTPFEMISEGKQAEYVDKSVEAISAEGHNNHMQIIVIGQKETETDSASRLSEKSLEMMKGNSAVTKLHYEKSSVMIGTESGHLLDFSFVEKSKKGETSLVVKEYIFSSGGALWRVIYQYRQGDALGEALTEKVAGQIVPGITF